jgi:hypothetical protein
VRLTARPAGTPLAAARLLAQAASISNPFGMMHLTSYCPIGGGVADKSGSVGASYKGCFVKCIIPKRICVKGDGWCGVGDL